MVIIHWLTSPIGRRCAVFHRYHRHRHRVYQITIYSNLLDGRSIMHVAELVCAYFAIIMKRYDQMQPKRGRGKFQMEIHNSIANSVLPGKNEFPRKSCCTYIFGIWILSASLWRPKSCHGLERELLSVEFKEEAFSDELGLPGTPPCTTARWMFVTETGMDPPLASSIPDDWHSSV